MPTYAYRCKKCDHDFEVVKKITEDNAEQCPECGSDTKRVFQPVGIIFKGSGFYTTDYARKKTVPPAATAQGEAKSDSNGSKKEEKPKTAAKK